MQALVGYTGFVGSNLVEQTCFDKCFNSKNIEEIKKDSYDLVVYSGTRAEKFLANQYPEKDRAHINETIGIIESVKTERLILISTIDVYDGLENVDENTLIDESKLQPYGFNRRKLEKWVEGNLKNYLIIRLPALYGNNLKKNFLYDLMYPAPTYIKKDIFFQVKESVLLDLSLYYVAENEHFFKLKPALQKEDIRVINDYFQNSSFNALTFTNHRSEFQFYGLSNLWRHIEIAGRINANIINLTTEPVTAGEIYEAVYNNKFHNEIPGKSPVKYNIRSLYSKEFGGEFGYIENKTEVLEGVRKFVLGASQK